MSDSRTGCLNRIVSTIPFYSTFCLSIVCSSVVLNLDCFKSVLCLLFQSGKRGIYLFINVSVKKKIYFLTIKTLLHIVLEWMYYCTIYYFQRAQKVKLVLFVLSAAENRRKSGPVSRTQHVSCHVVSCHVMSCHVMMSYQAGGPGTRPLWPPAAPRQWRRWWQAGTWCYMWDVSCAMLVTCNNCNMFRKSNK